jgi:hypothetical protein
VEGRELVVSMRADCRGKAGKRRGITGFQPSEGLQIGFGGLIEDPPDDAC